MATRNLTIQLDEDLIQAAKVLAAKNGTSVSAMMAQQLRRTLAHASRYERARESALRALAEVEDRGGASWTRAELHERR